MKNISLSSSDKRSPSSNLSKIETTVCDIESGEKNVLLIYPRPKLITYTDNQINYIKAGDRIENYEIMFADELVALLEKEENN